MSQIRLANLGSVEDEAEARDYLTSVWGLAWERHQPAPSASREAKSMLPLYGCHIFACAGGVDKGAGRSRSARMTCDDSSDSSSVTSTARAGVG